MLFNTEARAKSKLIETKKFDLPMSYIIYDYETYGVNVKSPSISQLAVLRLDRDGREYPAQAGRMNEIVYPNGDRLMSIMASLITRQSLALLQEHATKTELLLAYQFNGMLLDERNTCIMGYNNLKFDDTITQNLFYRNFINPYEWRYKNGNSRIDLLPMLVAYHSLCPHVLPQWPTKEDGSYDYKLESIAQANGFIHTNAHDAFSDVEACAQLFNAFKNGTHKVAYDKAVDLASLSDINIKPEECFEYLMYFRNKKHVSSVWESFGQEICVHFTPTTHRNTRGAVPCLVLNSFTDATNDQGAVLLDLLAEPDTLKTFLSLSTTEIQAYYALGSRYRKFQEPIIRTVDNKFPLFARFDQCQFNAELNSPEVIARIESNLEMVKSMNIVDFATAVLKSKDEWFLNQEPTKQTPLSIIKDTPLEDTNDTTTTVGYNADEHKTFEYINKLKDEEFTMLNFPDTKLNNVISDIFNHGAILFNTRNGPDPTVFAQSLSYLSLNPIFNNLYILYLGNNYPDEMSKEQKIAYLEMKLQRLAVSYEEFKNEACDLREKYLKGELAQFNPADIKELIEQGNAFYHFYRNDYQQNLATLQSQVE